MNLLIPILAMVVIGIVMGVLASNRMRAKGFGIDPSGNGLDRYIIAGLIGSFLGGTLSISMRIGGLLGELILGTIGAVSVLFVLGRIKKS